MGEMLQPILLFILGLVLLIIGGNLFVDGAAAIARKFCMPELLVGATVVSIGTTLPEVMVSASSAISGHGEIAYGNAVGSVICNTALIAAISLAVKPGEADKKAIRLPAWFFFVAGIFYAGTAYLTGRFSRLTGVILLAGFAAYMTLTVRQAIKSGEDDCKEDEPTGGVNTPPLAPNLAKLAAGAVMIAFGANLLVDNGTLLARAFGVPESVIALTFVAVGTSLPELVTAVTSLIKGHGALSLGNIIGANLFNLVLVSGVSVVLAPFSIPAGKHLFGYNASLVLDLPLMFAVMAILTVPVLAKGRTYRWQGIVLLALYIGFCAIQFAL